jgi:large subunit ribosomal protein L29
MKAAEVREKSVEELNSLESDLGRELWQARFDNHGSRLDDTAKIRKLRRTISRVKTVLTQRVLEANKKPAPKSAAKKK